jgi:hypothetical protein
VQSFVSQRLRLTAEESKFPVNLPKLQVFKFSMVVISFLPEISKGLISGIAGKEHGNYIYINSALEDKIGVIFQS